MDGDGLYDDSPMIVAQYTYNTVGTYTVDLKVTDSEGAWATLATPLTIYVVPVGSNFPPTASGNVNCAFPMVGEAIHFTQNSFDTDGSVVKWEWNFDDGTGWHDYTATQGDTMHSFASEGVYQVDLRVTDNLGATGQLPTKLTILVSKPTFTIPTDPPECTGTATHSLAMSTSFATPNVDSSSRAIAFLQDGTYLTVIGNSVYNCQQPANMAFSVLDNASWVKQIRAGADGVVALSGLDDGVIKVYHVSNPQPLQLVKEIDLGHPIDAFVFDDTNQMWIYGDGELCQATTPDYQLNPCSTFSLPQVKTYGTVDDMNYCMWNHSIYLAINDGAGGTVAEIDYLGNFASAKSNILGGPSRYMTILIDRDSDSPSQPSTSDCRMEVLGGQNSAYITRLNANLDVLAQYSYGFWGIRGATLDHWSSHEVIALEDCCTSWIDLLIPPEDWMKIGG